MDENNLVLGDYCFNLVNLFLKWPLIGSAEMVNVCTFSSLYNRETLLNKILQIPLNNIFTYSFKDVITGEIVECTLIYGYHWSYDFNLGKEFNIFVYKKGIK